MSNAAAAPESCDGVGRSGRGWRRRSVRQVDLLAPVRLEQDAIDLLELDGFGAVADGFEQGAQAEISRLAQTAIGRAHDEAECVVGEGAVGERGLVELGPDE